MASDSSFPFEIAPQPIPRSIKTAIGEMILVGAEIDHLVSMALFSISKLHPTNGFVILKRMGVTEKMSRLDFFVFAKGDEKTIIAFEQIKADLVTFTALRNCVAHGIYLGHSSRGLCFANTADYADVDQHQSFIHKVHCFPEECFPDAVKNGNFIARSMRETFDVKTLHETFPSQFHSQKPQSRRAVRKNAPKAARSPN